MKKALILSLLSVVFVPLVSIAVTVSISPNLPGSLSSVSSPGAWIKSFYTYALFISGALAFGAIVYGGIKYAIARGNPSGESEAKQWIWSALLGMLLLAAAYLILFTINPNLVNLTLPTLPSAPASTGSPNLNQVGQQIQNSTCGGSTLGTCPNAQDGNIQTCQHNSSGYYCSETITINKNP